MYKFFHCYNNIVLIAVKQKNMIETPPISFIESNFKKSASAQAWALATVIAALMLALHSSKKSGAATCSSEKSGACSARFSKRCYDHLWRFSSPLVIRWLILVLTALILSFKAKLHTNPLNTRIYLMCIRSCIWYADNFFCYFPRSVTLELIWTSNSLGMSTTNQWHLWEKITLLDIAMHAAPVFKAFSKRLSIFLPHYYTVSFFLWVFLYKSVHGYLGYTNIWNIEHESCHQHCRPRLPSWGHSACTQKG